MPTVAQRLSHVNLKVKRAREHVEALQREVGRFLATQPYRVDTKRDPESRRLIYFISSVEPTPESLPLIVGDTIQNLVSALDHLAFQIVCSDTGDAPPAPRRIYFPIAENSAAYESAKHGKMEGARQEVFDALDRIKPYKGGNDLLWQLGRLNNIEKHRVLITVGSRYRSINLGAHVFGLFQKAVDSNSDHPFHSMDIPKFDLYFGVSDAEELLTPGHELFSDAPDAEVNQKMDFRFDVAIHEPEVGPARPALETVQQFTSLVEGIVTSLTPLLRDSP